MTRMKSMTTLLFLFSIFFASCAKDDDKTLENQLPVANAGADQEVMAGERVQLSGSASSDPEKATLKYLWTVAADNPHAVELSGNKSVTPFFTAPDVSGEYSFSLVVNDGQNDSKTDEVVISVKENTADNNEKPVADAGSDKTVDAGAQVQLDGSNSSDKEGEKLTYKWTVSTANPETVTLSADNVVNPGFSAPQTAGNYVFQLVVNDGSQDSEMDEVSITVQEVSSQSKEVLITDVPRNDVLLQSVAFGKNTFVAVGFYGNSFNDEDRGSINYSSDGENWTEVANMTGGDSWHEVIFANNRFIATGNDGAIATSLDGQNWTKTYTSEKWDWLSVSYHAGTYIFTSKSARYAISKQDDFADLTIYKSNYNSDVWYCITHHNNQFVMVGNDGRIGHSPDGDNWTFKTIDKQNYRRLTGVTYGNEGYVATVSQGSTTIARSNDGENWTLEKNSAAIQGGKFVNDTYVLLGAYSSNKKIYLTKDMDLANAEKLDADGDWHDVAFGNNTYVIVGSKVGVLKL